MGRYITDSARRRSKRLTLRPSERPTLLLCPVCAATGEHRFEADDGRYGVRACRWCFGSGAIDAIVGRLWKRWLALRNANRKNCWLSKAIRR